MSQDVGQEGGEEDDVAPAALRVVVLPDGGRLHLLLPPLPGGGGGDGGRRLEVRVLVLTHLTGLLTLPLAGAVRQGPVQSIVLQAVTVHHAPTLVRVKPGVAW